VADCSVVMYHYVRDVQGTAFADMKVLPVEKFRTQLDWIAAHYEIIDYRTFQAALFGKLTLPRATALLTFDDGLIEHYQTVFPLLKERGLSGVFCVPTGSLNRLQMLNVHRIHFLLAYLGPERLRDEVAGALKDRPGELSDGPANFENLYRFETSPDGAVKRLLNYELRQEVADELLTVLFERFLGDEQEWAQQLYCSRRMLKEMAAGGMTLGGHTIHHRVLSRLSAARQREEVAQAPALIRGLCGQQDVPFCFPYGLIGTYGPETLAALEAEGYATAFTIVPAPVVFETAQRFELSRLDTVDIEALRAAEQSQTVPVHAGRSV
jgi:peptidoglycan/xylan/chitin deacetylase (PgdA/CDA1 family)